MGVEFRVYGAESRQSLGFRVGGVGGSTRMILLYKP